MITKLAWEEQEVEDLVAELRLGDGGSEEVEVMRLQGGNENDEGTEGLSFWFPGFVGESPILSRRVPGDVRCFFSFHLRVAGEFIKMHPKDA